MTYDDFLNKIRDALNESIDNCLAVVNKNSNLSSDKLSSIKKTCKNAIAMESLGLAIQLCFEQANFSDDVITAFIEKSKQRQTDILLQTLI